MPLNHPHCHGRSDVGSVRERNEDQFLIADLCKSMLVHQSTLIRDESRLFSDVQGQLLLVADGMGGHAAGDRASQLTTATIADYVLQTMPWFMGLHHEPEEHLDDILRSAVAACDRAVSFESNRAPTEVGMGTTLTMAYVIWPRMYVVHVGDSRCYLFRGDSLRQISRDQTMLRMLEEDGSELSDDVRRRFGSILLNSIGHSSERLRTEVYRIDLEEEDVILLCSDGLSDTVEDAEIEALLRRHSTDEQACCDSLVQAANDRGGRDNVTVVVSRYPRVPSRHRHLSDTQVFSLQKPTA